MQKHSVLMCSHWQVYCMLGNSEHLESSVKVVWFIYFFPLLNAPSYRMSFTYSFNIITYLFVLRDVLRRANTRTSFYPQANIINVSCHPTYDADLPTDMIYWQLCLTHSSNAGKGRKGLAGPDKRRRLWE